MTVASAPRLTYLLPIKSACGPSPEQTAYLREIAERMPLVIVDGSAPEVFASAHDVWATFAVHLPPDPHLRCANGKVHGVRTGLRLVTTEGVLIADDDVRYSESALDAVAEALTDADLVSPQNHFVEPMPWHARWDMARTLCNRATGFDFPGTLAVRMDILRTTDGYDGDVLFENLELMRTVRAAGGRCVARPDLYVPRLPPTARHFCGQRVRQAYDELARPGHLVAYALVVPALIGAIARRRTARLAVAGAVCVAVAEIGRRRAEGARIFPWTSSLFAPLWVLERGVCTWLALARRARGGIDYADRRLVRAASTTRSIRRRLEERDVCAGCARPTQALAPAQERPVGASMVRSRP